MANVNITKRAIQEAFLAVLNEKPLGKITVKDITDRCGINRNTFYYHYQDIPALLEEICQNQVEDISHAVCVGKQARNYAYLQL